MKTSRHRGGQLCDRLALRSIRHNVRLLLYVKADATYNLACPASPIQNQRDPVKTTKTSVRGEG